MLGTQLMSVAPAWYDEKEHGQRQKAQEPIEVTESGIWTEVRLLHPRKARLPMEVTECGIRTKSRLVHQ